MKYTFTVEITTEEAYPLWLIKQKVEGGFACVNGCSDPNEMVQDYTVKVTDHKLSLGKPSKDKKEEAHKDALLMFQGEKIIPEGATLLAKQRVKEFGMCSEVIIAAYSDFILSEMEFQKE